MTYALFQIVSRSGNEFTVKLLYANEAGTLRSTYVFSIYLFNPRYHSLFQPGLKMLYTNKNRMPYWSLEGAPEWDRGLAEVVHHYSHEKIFVE